MIGFALLLVFYAGVAYLAYQRGTDDRTQQAIQELSDQAREQLELAQQDLLAGRYQLAQKRLEFVLEVNPNNEQAKEYLLTIPNAVLPTIQIVHTAEPLAEATTDVEVVLPTLEPTATPRPIGNASKRLAQVEKLIENESWDEAVTALVAFQLDFPGYERYTTDVMLFEAYSRAGFFHTNRNSIAIGIAYFEQAQKLGTLSEEAAGQLRYAKLYQDALAYYGINWPVAIQNFREICNFAPVYQDSCSQLYDAYVAYGDIFYNSKDFCPAATQYSQALKLKSSGQVQTRYNSANGACNTATTTPQWWEVTPSP
ncbi:MAG: hypothetical protein ACPG8W_21500 [Candidatus Promineifilaceae bacterium]